MIKIKKKIEVNETNKSAKKILNIIEIGIKEIESE
tara:strand:+ start:356 stop:460 length:105 start_codon:yes stop_codon:yes gene_type:complete